MVDTKISDLTAIAVIAGVDLIAVIDDPGGTPASRKGTITQVAAFLDGLAQTLTNKTIDWTDNTMALTSAELLTALSDETGSGLAVFNTSPTLVTPALGTPASGVLTNATGLPEAGLLDNAVSLAKMAHGTDGNLITYSATGAPAFVSTGTAAQVLTSNGVGAAPTFQAGGADNSARLGICGNQTICTATLTLVNWEIECYDTNSYHAACPNTQIIIPSGQEGKYLITATSRWETGSDTGEVILRLLNGCTEIGRTKMANSSGGVAPAFSTVIDTSACDVLKIEVWQNSGCARNIQAAGTSWAIQKVDKAG